MDSPKPLQRAAVFSRCAHVCSANIRCCSYAGSASPLVSGEKGPPISKNGDRGLRGATRAQRQARAPRKARPPRNTTTPAPHTPGRKAPDDRAHSRASSNPRASQTRTRSDPQTSRDAAHARRRVRPMHPGRHRRKRRVVARARRPRRPPRRHVQRLALDVPLRRRRRGALRKLHQSLDDRRVKVRIRHDQIGTFQPATVRIFQAPRTAFDSGGRERERNAHVCQRAADGEHLDPRGNPNRGCYRAMAGGALEN